MENKVETELDLMEAEKEGDNFYQKMLENMTDYAEKLREFYNQVVMMRLESVKARLDYLKCVQELEYTSNLLD